MCNEYNESHLLGLTILNKGGHKSDISRHVIRANCAICPGMAPPDLVWGGLQCSQRAPLSLLIYPKIDILLNMYSIVLCCLAEPRSHHFPLFLRWEQHIVVLICLHPLLSPLLAVLGRVNLEDSR
jgi:hypothetical protein